MITPEGKVKKQIRDLLDSFPTIWYFSPQGGRFGKSGIPDIIGCYRGKFFAVEVKAPGKKENTTALQKAQIQAIRDVWGQVIVVDNATDFSKWLHDAVF